MLAVVEGGLSVAAAAVKFGVSKRWLRVLLARYRQYGIEAVEPRSTSAPNVTNEGRRHDTRDDPALA